MICKSCQNNVEGKFCSICGQKTDTHRLSFKHFVEHDLIHGVLHLDRGLPFTIKEIIIRPAKVVREYIQGNRKPYYNFFYILLLISGVFLFLIPLLIEPEISKEESSEVIKQQLANMKFYLFAYIPIYAVSSFFLFKKLKFNFIEHCIAAVVATIGLCIVNIILLGIAFPFGLTQIDNSIIAQIFISFGMLIMLFFPAFTYYGLLKSHYKNAELILRIAAFLIVTVALISLLKIGLANL